MIDLEKEQKIHMLQEGFKARTKCGMHVKPEEHCTTNVELLTTCWNCRRSIPGFVEMKKAEDEWRKTIREEMRQEPKVLQIDSEILEEKPKTLWGRIKALVGF